MQAAISKIKEVNIAQYIKPILVIVGCGLALWAVYLVYKIMGKAKSQADSVADAINNTTADATLSKASGLTPKVIAAMRKAAHDIAVEMETLKDMGWWQKASHFVDGGIVSGIIKKNVSTPAEMRMLRSVYEREMTNNGNLLKDLQSSMSDKTLSEIPYVSELYH